MLIRQKVGAELSKQGKTRAYNWLISQTEPLEPIQLNSGSNIMKPIWIDIWAEVIVALFFIYEINNIQKGLNYIIGKKYFNL